jgi:hypothetical protein
MHASQNMSAAADKNLLFGVVALQMDFISRDALLAAMLGSDSVASRAYWASSVNCWALAHPRGYTPPMGEQCCRSTPPHASIGQAINSTIFFQS